MIISMYQASVPRFVNILGNLSNILDKAQAHVDAKKLDALMAKDVSFVNIFGTYLATRAEAMKDWTGTGCQVKSVSVTDGFATALSPTVTSGQRASSISSLVTTRPACSTRYRSTSKLLGRRSAGPDGPSRHSRSRSRVKDSNSSDLGVVIVT